MWCALAAALLTVQSPATAQDELPQIAADALTDEHVLRAIEAIVEELYTRKDAEHFWDPPRWSYNPHGDENQTGGYTALCALALLYAGESYQNPRLRDAIDDLETSGMSGTYAVAIRAHIWAKLPQKYHPNLEKDQQWLIDGFSERVRGWGYTQQPNASRQDQSLRQYGALGLWEAAKRGVECDARYWRMLEEAYIESQLADGGWNYRANSSPPRGSMTAAGLTVLFITQDYLHAEESVKLPRRVESRHQHSIDLALKWMAENFSPTQNPGRDADFYYYLYGVERVGMASGYRYFGEHDWFREGAAELIRRLCNWDEPTRTMTVHEHVGGNAKAGLIRNHHLAFALMFLSRGRSPIAINKLQIDELHWNNRPRDVANLTAFISDSTETMVSWQIVDFAAGPETWLDAPMLYLASDKPLPWLGETNVNPQRLAVEARKLLGQQSRGEQPVDAVIAKPNIPQLVALKTYLDHGGLLLAVNEGAKRSFADSIEEAGRIMYPQYEWRNLPPDHWAYTLAPVHGRRVPLKGLSNGVRELIIISPMDISRTFQSRAISDSAQEQVAANVYFYASEFNAPKLRLIALGKPATNTAEPAGEANTFTISRALYDGNWDAEPVALRQWRNAVQSRFGQPIRVTTVALSALHETKPQPNLVIVTGVDPHVFTVQEQLAIEAYIKTGGTILFETVGGVGEFTTAAEKVLEELFKAPPQSLFRQAIITGDGITEAMDLGRVQYRPFALQTFGARETTPRVRAIFVDDKPRVLLSREDVSHALLDQPSWGVSGYTTDSARNLLLNIVRWVDHASAPQQ